MGNVKISQLPSAGTVAGTEVFPIVQSGQTKKLSIDNLEQNSIAITVANLNTAITNSTLLVDRIYKITNAFSLYQSTTVYVRSIAKNLIDSNGIAVFKNSLMTNPVVFNCIYSLSDDSFTYLHCAANKTTITLDNSTTARLNFVKNNRWDFGSNTNKHFINCVGTLNTINSNYEGHFEKCNFNVTDSNVSGFFLNTQITCNNSTLGGQGFGAIIDLLDSSATEITIYNASQLNLSDNSTVNRCIIGEGKIVNGYGGYTVTNCSYIGNKSTFYEVWEHDGNAGNELFLNFEQTGIIKLGNNALGNTIQKITHPSSFPIDIELVYNGYYYKVQKNNGFISMTGTDREIDNLNNHNVKLYFTKFGTTTNWVLTGEARLSI